MVFPARAGMNRPIAGLPPFTRRVPRAGGDEPATGTRFDIGVLCSPRGRG